MVQPTVDPAKAFAELGRIRLDETSLDEVLRRVADLANQIIPGTRDVSVTLVRDRPPGPWCPPVNSPVTSTSGSTSRTAAPVWTPRPAATRSSLPDMAAEQRWPDWAARAHAAGVASSLSIGLPIQESVVGALNVYGAAAHAFDPQAITVAERFAAYAAVALANAHLYDRTAVLAEQMQAAMRSRAVIEQAKGIIMGERHCSPDAAFALLSKISQDTNRKVRDVAEALVANAVRKSRP